jgi:hypothetical protein
MAKQKKLRKNRYPNQDIFGKTEIYGNSEIRIVVALDGDRVGAVDRGRYRERPYACMSLSVSAATESAAVISDLSR